MPPCTDPSEKNVSGNARRLAKHRAAHARLDIAVDHRIAETIAGLSSEFDASKTEVVNSLLRFALTNRDWKKQGLIWGK